jgi:hypothetical protein
VVTVRVTVVAADGVTVVVTVVVGVADVVEVLVSVEAVVSVGNWDWVVVGIVAEEGVRMV